MFSQEELLRYSRQLPVIGLEGQKLLAEARVLIVGAGGLGCPALLYLVTSGIGHVGIVDGDVIELSNLHRQVLFNESDLGLKKAEVAKSRLQPLNSHCEIVSYPVSLIEDNAAKLIDNYQVVVDATDNYPARYLINKICRKQGIPLVSASIYQFSAQLSVFNYHDGPCYECLYPAPPGENLIPNCAQAGILGVLAGIAGTLQAMEVIKIITNQGNTLSGKLLGIDLLTHQYKQYPVSKKLTCTPDLCSTYQPQTVITTPSSAPAINALELAKSLTNHPEQYYLIDVREPYESEICSIGGTLIPLANLEQQLDQLPRDKILVTYCKAGKRSEKAASLLLQNNFSQVYFLEGGILAWIDKVDPTFDKY